MNTETGRIAPRPSDSPRTVLSKPFFVRQHTSELSVENKELIGARNNPFVSVFICGYRVGWWGETPD
jgi:hypothetical protein